jgi:hypothetical protein
MSVGTEQRKLPAMGFTVLAGIGASSQRNEALAHNSFADNLFP